MQRSFSWLAAGGHRASAAPVSEAPCRGRDVFTRCHLSGQKCKYSGLKAETLGGGSCCEATLLQPPDRRRAALPNARALREPPPRKAGGTAGLAAPQGPAPGLCCPARPRYASSLPGRETPGETGERRPAAAGSEPPAPPQAGSVRPPWARPRRGLSSTCWALAPHRWAPPPRTGRPPHAGSSWRPAPPPQPARDAPLPGLRPLPGAPPASGGLAHPRPSRTAPPPSGGWGPARSWAPPLPESPGRQPSPARPTRNLRAPPAGASAGTRRVSSFYPLGLFLLSVGAAESSGRVFNVFLDSARGFEL